MRKLRSLFQSFPRYSSSTDSIERLSYKPLLVECGDLPRSGFLAKTRTWFVCWSDHFDPNFSICFWTVFSCLFYFADLGADLSVAFEYFDSKNYFWFSFLFGFTILPFLVSIAFHIAYEKRIWYQVYPVGIFYWSYLTLRTFLALGRNQSIQTPNDAKDYLLKLRKFQFCNRERTRVGDVDIYFGAMPQLILQSYIAVEVAKETGIATVTWVSWVSLCLSSLSLLRFEPTSRQSKNGIVIDIETVLEPAIYDYILENLFDLMSVVPRAITIGCFLTIEPSYAAALAFFSLHIIITFFWFWLSAPKRIPRYRSTDRDFRGQRRDRGDLMAHLQASLATLLFPPTHRAWPENFQSWTDRFRAVMTKQFCVVTLFQFGEILILLAFWTFFSEGHFPVVATLVSVISWSTARTVCHVFYYVFILFPLYISEWEGCCRRRGLIAKMEIIRMAEDLGGYFCRNLRPRLEKIEEFCKKKDSEKIREKCVELLESLLEETVGRTQLRRSRTQKHRLQAMISSEKDLLRAVHRQATDCIERIDDGKEITENDAIFWETFICECERLSAAWEEILLACLTHQKLPISFVQAERDLGLAQYPEMFQKLVIKNDLKLKKQNLQHAQLPRRQPVHLNNVTSPEANLELTDNSPEVPLEFQYGLEMEDENGFGKDFDFEPID